jgi:cell division septation protein DedD
MSVSYTGDPTMDEPALRDVERWKGQDKIEVRLDNRQVFFLFFGSALCACMLFVLGVIVGKRLESRGRAAAPEVQDPLAVLDRINSVGVAGAAVVAAGGKPAEPALTFPKALIGTSSPPHASTATGTHLSNVPATPRVPVVVAPKAPAAAPPRAPAAVPKVVASVPKVLLAATAPPSPRPAAPVTVKVGPPSPAVRPVAAVLTAKMPPAPVAAVVPPKGAGHFTLQLGSYPDRGEAEAFAKRFTAQGAFIVSSDVPGKGTWYRVRVGSYVSSQEAIAAKGSFEKQTNTIAYIAGK